MSKIVSKGLPQLTKALKATSLGRMLPGLMRADVLRRLGFYGALFGLIVSALLYCGTTPQVFAAGPERVGLPWDWSHEHLLFSKTDDPAIQAIIQKDPRAFHQWLRRTGVADGVPISFDTFVHSEGTLFGSPSPDAAAEPRSESAPVSKGKNDWGVSLGATQFNTVNSTGAPLYPAKYKFDINAAPSCINDYAVFPTGAQGTSSQASIVAYNNLYSTQGGSGALCLNTGPLVYWAYINAVCTGGAVSSSDPILSSPVISQDGTKIAWVTTTGKVQILAYGSGFTSGPPEGALTPACISSVNGSVPPVGGDGATLQTWTLGNALHNPSSVSVSEVFVDYSSDSAYVGDDDGYLHKISPFFTAAAGPHQEVITPGWLSSHAYSAGSLIVDTNGFIEKCTTAGTSGLSTPAWSATWNTNTNDNGVIWKNIGSGGGWPVYVTGSSTHTDNSKLNAPIFDSVSKNVIVGAQNGSLYYVLDPPGLFGAGSCANGQTLFPCLGQPGVATGIAAAGGSQADCAAASPGPTCMVMSNKQGFTDALVVDITNNLVITQFSNVDGTHAEVEQTNSSLSVFHSVTLTSKANSTAHHSGAFDNNYYSTPASGYYYVCAPAPTGSGTVTTDLFRVSFTNTGGTIALGSVNGTPLKLTATGTSGDCAPLTEIYNAASSPAHDWLFLSLDTNGGGATCANSSCVLSFALASNMVTGPHAGYGSGGTPPGIANMNGTGGMIIDNVANVGTYPDAASLYFMPVANNLTCGDGTSDTGCAVKLTQAGLH